MATRAEKIAKRRAEMPETCRGVYDKAVAGKSLRAAVNAFCLECVGWKRQEITQCTSPACPLYAARPYRNPRKAQIDSAGAPESTNAETEEE